MYADEDEIKKIDDDITKMETATPVRDSKGHTISGWYSDEHGTKVYSNELTYEQAAKYLDATKKDLDHDKAVSKAYRDRAAAERIAAGK